MSISFALGGPGRNDESGARMYTSGLSFIAFLLTTRTFLVLGAYVPASRRRSRRAGVES